MSNKPLLQLNNISKAYKSPEGPSLHVLQNINLSVEAGDSLAITGPSGSGKSTLLNILGTLDKPSSGELLIEGQPTTTMDENQQAAVRNKKIGFIFQSHHLLPQCNVLENVLIPSIINEENEDAEEMARRILDYVGLTGRLTHLPGALSVGERQRVAVARALINHPHIILADEPTGSLDHKGADNLASLMIKLNREEGIAMIVVTHSQHLAEQMSRQLTLDNGSLQQK